MDTGNEKVTGELTDIQRETIAACIAECESKWGTSNLNVHYRHNSNNVYSLSIRVGEGIYNPDYNAHVFIDSEGMIITYIGYKPSRTMKVNVCDIPTMEANNRPLLLREMEDSKIAELQELLENRKEVG